MRTRIAAVAFLVTTALAAPAAAELSLGMGTRWTPTRYNVPVFAGDVARTGNLLAGPNSETGLDAYFLMAFSRRFGIYLQLDYQNVSWACESGDSDNVCSALGGDSETSDMSFSTFGLELGAKLYFAEPRRAAISPLVTFGGFAYFSSVTDSEANEDDQFALGDLSSPLGLRLALGVEYNFSNNFSIGAEIFGLRFAHASTVLTSEDNDSEATIIAQDADTTYDSLSLYTAITLNFRFYGLFRVYTREEEEQATQEEREDRHENQQFNQWQNQGQNPNQPQQQQWQQNQQQQWQQPQQQQWQQNQQPQQWQQNQQPQQQQQWQQGNPAPQDPNQQWQQPTPTP